MAKGERRLEIGQQWDLDRVDSVHELKSNGGLEGAQRTRYLNLTDGGKKLFVHVSKNRWKPAPGGGGGSVVTNNRRTVLTQIFSSPGLALSATVVIGVIPGESLAAFDELMFSIRQGRWLDQKDEGRKCRRAG
ncbi:hypothetical protein [Fontivita pretiosa]|uniref:hypothetical protein n=1 Tax=Fontivita pretiosa TaxID=2989684 RepID=UPI003D17D7C4